MLFISKEDLSELIDLAVMEAMAKALQKKDTLAGHALDLEKKVEALSAERHKRIDALQTETLSLKEQVADLETKKKNSMLEIEAKVKVHDEKMKFEHEKAMGMAEIKRQQDLAKMDREFAEKETKLLKEFHVEHLKMMKEGETRLQELYAKILDRLPNVNYTMEKRI